MVWEDIPQPDPRSILPISYTIKTGLLELNFVTNTDENGNFLMRLNGLPPGEPYVWRVKGTKSLANSGTSVTPGDPCSPNFAPNVVNVGVMRAGDANDDNIINISDFNALKLTFGRACGNPGFNSQGDFNNDCVVSIADFNLLKRNFGTAGSPPIRPFGARSDIPILQRGAYLSTTLFR